MVFITAVGFTLLSFISSDGLRSDVKFLTPWRADVASHDVFTTIPILQLQIYFSVEL